MFSNYLKIAFRNLLKYKAYSAINVFGLAIGIACCAIIFLYVQHETGYDNYHRDIEQLYRVAIMKGVATINQGQASVSYETAEMFRKDYPEVLNTARIFQFGADVAVKIGEQLFPEKRFYFAEQSLFELLTIPFLYGYPQTALTEPHSLVVSEAVAQKYFNQINALGKTLTLSAAGVEVDYKITGVVRNAPQNTHFKYDLLATFDDWEAYIDPPDFLKSWFSYNFWTYLKLKEGYPASQLEAKFPEFIKRYFPETRQDNELFLQKVRDIHLHSHLENEFEANNNIIYIYIFSIVAVLVLVIACINFMNLTTARSMNRAKEVGMRKVLGAQRMQLVKQFLMEALLTSVFALILALALVELFVVIINDLVGASLRINYLGNFPFLLLFIGIALLTGLFAGIYPAFFLSSYQPVKVLKGMFSRTSAGASLRKALVTAQMVITVILLIGIITISRQLDYVRNKNLGFQKEQVLLIEVNATRLADNTAYNSFKDRLLQHSEIRGVTKHTWLMGQEFPIRSIFTGAVSEAEKIVMPFVFVGHDYATVYGLEFLEGRDFSKEFSTDTTFAYILSESAVKQLGLSDPIGREIASGDRNPRRGPIVGVIKDFHFNSLHKPIEPLILGLFDFGMPYIAIRLDIRTLPQTVEIVKETWNEFEPQRPMSFFFLDDRLNQVYSFEARLGKIVSYFTGLAIFIACLGLFGMASFTAQQRTKEIGVRKILGATVRNIILSFCAEFTKLVLIANLIAWPVSYLLMKSWLQSFAYRIDIGWWIFALAGTLALLIALLTVSYQAIRAAVANPVKSLRYE